MDSKERDIGPLRCQPCLADDNQVLASFYCIDCKECQCLRCKDVHRRFSYMTGHQIVKVKPTFTKEDINRFNTYFVCNVHNRKLEFICTKDNTLCCTECKENIHKTCQNVQEISHIANKDIDDFGYLQRETDGLRNKVMTLSKYLRDTYDALNNESPEMEKLTKALTDMKEKLFRKIDNFTEQLIADGRRQIEFKSKATIKKAELSEKLVTYIDELFEDIDYWKQVPHPQNLIIRHRLAEQFKECEEKFKDVSAHLRTPGEVTLSLHNKVHSLVEHKSDIGSVYYEDHGGNLTDLSDHRAVRIELLHSRNLRRRTLDQDNLTPDITGISFLDDGKLVVIDKTNRNIRIHEKHSTDLIWKTELTPCDVATVCDGKFVVTFPGLVVFYKIINNELYEYKHTRNVLNNSTISVKDKNSYVIGTSGANVPALLITDSGQEKDLNLRLNDCSSYSSKSLFFRTRVAELLAISFKDFNCILLIDMETKEHKNVANDELIKPGYMCIGPLDTLFVCCDLGKVVHLTAEGSVLSALSTDIIEPKCISMSKDQTELAVAGSGQLLVYKIVKTDAYHDYICLNKKKEKRFQSVFY
ncbi:uncharacterized protein LOC132730928 [Ruditapes philippinarum]|uniref:uncharacterized protein LOC132730928 n=1 Tax=Ruditapes philippinarum TaxID=129788 RepID=UPI00295AFD70|nr:uncharacterized protein LOC132730928 [Ruditapes philippinarum]XP_060572993.1 uncharacterized protein LOC132730928 [Ruditapes philippinarum]XP_060572994.1 uncharacterized protein LOC132730928 [Ruditapes philippinarum]